MVYISHIAVTALFYLPTCGGGRIRTYGPLARPTVFKTAALNHSATPPCEPRVSLQVALNYLFSLSDFTTCQRTFDIANIQIDFVKSKSFFDFFFSRLFYQKPCQTFVAMGRVELPYGPYESPVLPLDYIASSLMCYFKIALGKAITI